MKPAAGKPLLIAIALGLLSVIVFGLLWFFIAGPSSQVGVGWYLFSFAAGLTMIVLPCTLPLAFVIVPLSMGKSPLKGFLIALAFGSGVALTLSTYGILAAIVGKLAIGSLGAPLEVVKNWLYFVAGTFAYLFALGELGFIKFRMPTYTGAAPAFIDKQKDVLKALLLGLFMGNIGVGCPHPATPVILTRIAVTENVFYGWSLFFVHAVGRVIPLLLLAILGILGVNALSWLVDRKKQLERATGWGMVFVAGFILVLGLFSHDWWVYSGQHTLLESVTGEEQFLGAIIKRFNLTGVPHAHGIPTGIGLFGLPLWLGNWVLVGLWVVPLLWWLIRKSRQFSALPEDKKPLEKAVAPWQVAFVASFSMLLALTFIWVLPDRFLNHFAPMMAEHHEEMHAKGEDMHMEGTDMHATGSAMMDHEAGGHTALSHEEISIKDGLVVNLNYTPVPVRTTRPTKLDFFVNSKPASTPVTALEENHTKVMHVVGVRDDMNEFLHIHPQKTDKPGVLSISHTFANPGNYKLWSEVRVAGVDHTFGHPIIAATGTGELARKDVSFGRSVIAGQHQVTLEAPLPLIQKREQIFTFDIHDAQGNEVELEDYLGTKMHLSIIRDDFGVFIHTHPEDAAHTHAGLLPSVIGRVYAHTNEAAPVAAGEVPDHGVSFRTTFPEPGLYRAYAQFRPKGSTLPTDEAITASFWLSVEEKGATGPTPWWGLLIVSLVAMGALSVATRNFLTNIPEKKVTKP